MLEKYPQDIVRDYRAAAEKLTEEDFAKVCDEDGHYIPGQIPLPKGEIPKELKKVKFSVGRRVMTTGVDKDGRPLKKMPGDELPNALDFPNLQRHLDRGTIVAEPPVTRAQLAGRVYPNRQRWDVWEACLAERLQEVSPDFVEEPAPVIDPDPDIPPTAIIDKDEDGNEIILQPDEIRAKLRKATTAKDMKRLMEALGVNFPVSASKSELESIRKDYFDTIPGPGVTD